MRDRLALPSEGPRFSPQLLYTAATLYYVEDATQAEIADRLGTSRATVSRLLSEARRLGIVKIEVIEPVETDTAALAGRVAEALGLTAVHLSTVPAVAAATPGAALAPAAAAALAQAGLTHGDVLIVSSGRTVFEVAQASLPALPGVRVTPTVGGQDDPNAWYQTNEITRMVAAKIGGSPTFLYAPALPGPDLHGRLLEDDSVRRVTHLWEQARCALLGVGAPPATRRSIPAFVPIHAVATAVGDICNHFFDRDGNDVPFPGDDRLIATSPELLRRIPVGIAVAGGPEKVAAIAAGARAGYFNQLVTDVPTAQALLTLGVTGART
ncbi:sugar-binding transcriptional regulator [Spirilliplanes yamanashiensis]|uniref:Transcriptional regulator n=1 Tax=Spirilliplanes yamanashiensis TaxID=42233 RepID=A0A8J3Y9C9_9ACTN|nr:sugar-binding domain-containing protein [Spirilliplanes yamanashiensis]MDP9817601.1 DNA-binding transcriptional regulator LsrR (DeoR family) [Spirilliplanes yamanashiensis]GIJ04411.1 transcriptional regulator [Spirilliplanes yamanashiensis]